MSDLTRRDAIARLAAAFAGAGALDRRLAADVHAAVLGQEGPGRLSYVPRALSASEYRTLERLTDLILPVDSGKPGALEAGVPAWIDTLLAVNADLQARYQAGLAWIDEAMGRRATVSFALATPADQVALLDVIAYRRNDTPERRPGIEFFVLLRRMTVDGFYTSPIGMRDIYQGNTARPTFTVPVEAMDYVIGRSPFR